MCDLDGDFKRCRICLRYVEGDDPHPHDKEQASMARARERVVSAFLRSFS